MQENQLAAQIAARHYNNFPQMVPNMLSKNMFKKKKYIYILELN